jgi:hypothetical protein
METEHFSKIEDNLYLGSMYRTDNKELLDFHSITHILVVGKHLQQHFPTVKINLTMFNI